MHYSLNIIIVKQAGSYTTLDSWRIQFCSEISKNIKWLKT